MKTATAWQNTIALAAGLNLIGIDFKTLEDIITLQFQRKGQAAVDENVGVARAGYEYAAAQFRHGFSLPETLGKPLAFVDGNSALAMGGAAAGVRFYAAYPIVLLVDRRLGPLASLAVFVVVGAGPTGVELAGALAEIGDAALQAEEIQVPGVLEDGNDQAPVESDRDSHVDVVLVDDGIAIHLRIDRRELLECLTHRAHEERQERERRRAGVTAGGAALTHSSSPGRLRPHWTRLAATSW